MDRQFAVRGAVGLTDGYALVGPAGRGVSISASESSNEFGTDPGIKFGGTRFFAGACVGLTTAGNSDPVFTLSLGTVFGGN